MARPLPLLALTWAAVAAGAWQVTRLGADFLPPFDEGSVQVRGVGDEAWTLRPEAKIVAGRTFRPGLRELVAGVGAQGQFAGLTPGREIRLGNQAWTVVGIFKAGNAMDSEVWGDGNVVASAYRRGSSRSSVFVRLTRPSDFAALKASLTSDPRLQVDVKTQREYVGDQLKQLTVVINFVGYFVGVIMAVGAVFGAINTMYSAVDSRTREIATLRAIGFGGLGVVISVMVESLALAIPGALLGAAIAWLLFNGHAAQISSLSFPLAVTPSLVVLGIVWSVVIGFIGGLAPSVRAARLQVATALRAT